MPNRAATTAITKNKTRGALGGIAQELGGIQHIMEQSDLLPLDPFAEELGKNLDPFDLICHIALSLSTGNRSREHAENVKKSGLSYRVLK
jgi:hypothetical protein